MNKEIIYIDGHAVVSDEKGNKREVECSNKLEDILKQENIIEDLETRKSNFEIELSNDRNTLTDGAIMYRDLRKMFFAMDIIIPLIAYLYLNSTVIAPELAVNFFNMQASSFFALFGLSITAIITEAIKFVLRIENKCLAKKIKGMEAQCDYLATEILEQKDRLQKMETEKSVEPAAKELKVLPIGEDKLYKEEVARYLELYETCGLEFDWLLKHYKKGNLQEVLDKAGFDDDAAAKTDAYMKKEEEKAISKMIVKKMRKEVERLRNH